MNNLEFNIHNSKIVHCIQQAIDAFSNDWKAMYGLFLHTEHLTRFVEFTRKGILYGFESYVMESGVTTQIDAESETLKQLGKLYQTLESNGFRCTKTIQTQLQTCIGQVPFSELLLLTGQRLSSTSLQSVDALPPLKATLLKACFTPFNDHMSTVVRAWEKHAERSEDTFWPPRKGNAEEKEAMMLAFVERFFINWAWWNVYSHQKHGYVFELRETSGHGMRWTKDGKRFIGFLEPFIEHKE